MEGLFVGRSQIEGLYFLLHGGREGSEDTEVLRRFAFLGGGFTIEKLRS